MKINSVIVEKLNILTHMVYKHYEIPEKSQSSIQLSVGKFFGECYKLDYINIIEISKSFGLSYMQEWYVSASFNDDEKFIEIANEIKNKLATGTKYGDISFYIIFLYYIVFGREDWLQNTLTLICINTFYKSLKINLKKSDAERTFG